MAKRRSKQDGGAKQDAPLFDYSPAEWSNIEEPIRAIGKSLLNNVRELLVGYADLYRFEMRLQTSAKDRRDWQTIARLSERLHQAVLAKIQRARKSLRGYRLKSAPYNLKEPLKGVLQIKKTAAALAGNRRLSTRITYQLLVLDLWVELGGKLQSTRHPKTGRPQGPLIRFFQAVTTPVMGASAYSLESLPAIIRRQKRARAAKELIRQHIADASRAAKELIRQLIADASHDPAAAEKLRKLCAIAPEVQADLRELAPEMSDVLDGVLRDCHGIRQRHDDAGRTPKS
jgi:hypothetical protein